MSLRIALLAAIVLGGSLAMRSPLPPAEAIALPPPPSIEQKRPNPLPALRAGDLQRLTSAPPHVVRPIDPSKIPQPPVAPEALQLLGVVTGSGGSYAIVGLNGGRPQTVARGGEIGGWRIAAIGARSIKLVRGRDSFERTLFQQRTTAATAPPIPPPSNAPGTPPEFTGQRAPNAAPPAIYAPPAPPIVPSPN